MNFKRTYHDYLFIIVFGLFVGYRLLDINLPFFDDEVGFYVKAVFYMQHHIISLLPGSIPGEYSRGHPLLFLYVYSLISKLSGFHIYLLHSVSLCFSVATLFITYTLCKKIYNPVMALATVILLMLQPVFLAQSLMVLPEMMLTFLSTLSIYYYTQNYRILYFIACSLALLTKESGVILPLALCCGDYINACLIHKKVTLKKLSSFLWTLLPLSVFLTFFIIQKIQAGWFFFPVHIDFVSFYYKDIVWRATQAIHFLFIKQGRVLWFILFILYIIKNYKKSISLYTSIHDRRFISISVLFLLGIICFASLNYSLHRYLLYGIPILCILSIYCLNNLILNKTLFAIAFIILCTTSIYFTKSNSQMYDVNLSFRDMVTVNKKAIAYMEDHFLYKASIIANSPICEEMSDTCMGYLKTKPFINVNLANDNKAIKYNNVQWCIINDPTTFNFNSLPFKVNKIINYKSSFASTGIYKVIH